MMTDADLQTVEGQVDRVPYSAEGAIANGAFAGVWRTYDANHRVRLEIDLTGAPCPDDGKLERHLRDALVARYLPSLRVPEVEAAAAIDWTALSGAGTAHADARMPRFLAALASPEPLVCRYGYTSMAMSVDIEQGSVGEASAKAVPFFVALLAGDSAAPLGRKYALAYLEGITDAVASAEEPDEIFAACAKALRKQVPALRKIKDKAIKDLIEAIGELE